MSNTYPPTPAPIPDPAQLHSDSSLSSYSPLMYSPDNRSRRYRGDPARDQAIAGEAVRFLLREIGDPDLEARVADRLRLPPTDADDLRPVITVFRSSTVPAGVLRWLVERDDQDANAIAYYMPATPEAVKRDILLGVPYGAATGYIPVSRQLKGADQAGLHYRSFQLGRPRAIEDHGDTDTRGLIDALYIYGAERRMKQIRHVAAATGARDWARIAAADQATPLPGYARWALCVHPACPPELRVQFGGTHPRYARRMRRAGIPLGGSGELVRTMRIPELVLAVLGSGRRLFPERVGAARDAVRPLVRRDLGGNLEAWSVLNRLMPQFSGTVPELIATSGAVAGGAG